MSVSGYSLQSYGEMITCEPRMGAFDRALRQSITPGCRVIDLGAGPGLFALLACRYGAGSVVAIEPDPSIEVGRQMARDNGFADRITFVRDLSTNWQPDRLADVVISDIRGVMPLFEHHVATIKDVRARLLKPGGVQIPGVDRVFAALIDAPKTYEGYRKPWLENDYGVDLTAAWRYRMHDWGRSYQPAEALLSDTQEFVRLDYNTITDDSHSARMTFHTARPGTAHGILMWFETELAPGIGYSNAPGAPEQVYGQGFFPLEQPVTLAEGAKASVDMAARMVNGQYIWNWGLRATDVEGRAHAFRQSSFKSQILGRDQLAPRAAGFCPPARPRQAVDAYCLGQFDGQTTLAQLVDQVIAAFPGHFPDQKSAFDHVAALSARYNKV